MTITEIEKAIKFVVDAHRGQKRKGTMRPYVFHPIEVGRLLSRNGERTALVVAGILHDVLEDTEIGVEELRAEFGDEVAGLVSAVSVPDHKKHWKEKKTHTIEYLRHRASHDTRMIECADKLANITDICYDLQVQGDGLWKRFNAGYEEQKWYYQELVKSLESLSGNYLYEEFQKKVQEVY